ncbi:TPA: hypothetical protein ACH3X2_010439 [Trebouxia sp. C0005]
MSQLQQCQLPPTINYLLCSFSFTALCRLVFTCTVPCCYRVHTVMHHALIAGEVAAVHYVYCSNRQGASAVHSIGRLPLPLFHTRRAWRQLSCCSQQYRLHDHWKAGLGLFPVCSQALQQLYPSTRVRLYRFSTGTQPPETASPQQSTNNQQSRPQSQQVGPDLSNLSPRLQQQFDHVQNTHLGNIVIPKTSTIQVAWSCDQCPSGYPHKWVQTPYVRSANDGCPFCSGKRTCKHNSLASKTSTAAASWDFSANEGTPDDYTAGSNYRATWNCQDCGLSWQTTIYCRALKGTGCPHCYKLRSGRKADGSRTNHSTFRGASGDHPLMTEWDKDANEKAGLQPEEIKLRSHIQVNWICRKCPMSLLHLYKATPDSRTQKCSGCPTVVPEKRANATLCRHTFLTLLRSGILTETKAIQVTLLLGHMQ